MSSNARQQVSIRDGRQRLPRIAGLTVVCSVLCLGVCLGGGTVMGAGDEQFRQLLEQGRRQLAKHDRAAVCRWIELHSPEVAHQLYSGLTRELYQQDRNVPAMLQLGICAMQFAEHQAQSAGNPEEKNAWLGRAKSLAYNLSANVWPAWDDPGVTIDATSADIGRDLARVNLRLARELDRDPLVLGNAWWLLGAHELNTRQWTAARRAFLEARMQFHQASRSEFEAMAAGYVRIVEILENNELGDVDQLLAQPLQQLNEDPAEDAKFFAQQLKSVLNWYREHHRRNVASEP